jgi:hypothetical protein
MSFGRTTTMLWAVALAVTGCQIFEPAAADLLSTANAGQALGGHGAER